MPGVPETADDGRQRWAGEPRSRGIEAHSIDYIPSSERHGKVWHLAPVWVAGNANLGSVAVGFVGVSVGASLFWTLIAVVTGCAFGTIFSALHSTQGPVLGLPQVIQSRPQFGYFGALIVFILALITYVGFNVFANVLAGESLQDTTGLDPKVAFILVSVIAGAIALIGYDSIHRAFRWISVAFLVVFLVLSGAALFELNWSTNPFAPGTFALAPFLIQFGASAGYQINWAIYVSDYTRYLPATINPRRTFWCTYLGMTISAAWLACLGGLLVTAYPQLDAVTGTHRLGDTVFPGFGTIAVLVAVLGLFGSLVMNMYGGSLTLISIADCLGRIRLTARARLVAVAAMTIGSAALTYPASDHFLANITFFLQVLLYLFAPWTAINLTDYFLVRRGHYSIREIFNPHGIYRRWNSRGLLSYLISFAVEVPFMATSYYTGPVAQTLNGADLSPFVGILVGAVTYWICYRGFDLPAEAAHIADLDASIDQQQPAGGHLGRHERTTEMLDG